MKRFVLSFIVVMSTLLVKSQGSVSFEDKPFVISEPKDPHIDSVLTFQASYNQLSAEEKEVIYWMNYVRLHPQKFNTSILEPFLTQFPEIKNSYSRSLSSELSTLKAMGELLPTQKLTSVAQKHAIDLGSTGSSISHNSSRGASFKERMNQAGLTNCISENVYEGKLEGLKAVIFLLIDNGVPNLGHRKNILSPQSKFTGVSFYLIKRRPSTYFLVQNFSCE